MKRTLQDNARVYIFLMAAVGQPEVAEAGESVDHSLNRCSSLQLAGNFRIFTGERDQWTS